MKHKIVIIGGGGHARVVMEILEAQPLLEIAGFTSTAEEERTEMLTGYKRLGTDDALDQLLRSGVTHAFVAIGDNEQREKCFGQARDRGFTMINAVSRDAVVSARARLGLNVAIMPGAVINAGTVIGDGAIVNTNATVDHDCTIGAFAHIAPGATLAGNVTIGEGAFLGAGTKAVPGVTVGRATIVGAGAVVTRDLPPHVKALGVPAVVRPDLR